MTKIFKHLAKHWAACLVIIALLLVQAYGDLTLPDYTSKIVDSIDPYVKATVYSFKVQKRFWRFLISTVLKSMYIDSTRNVLWHIWWIKRKWIPDVL